MHHDIGDMESFMRLLVAGVGSLLLWNLIFSEVLKRKKTKKKKKKIFSSLYPRKDKTAKKKKQTLVEWLRILRNKTHELHLPLLWWLRSPISTETGDGRALYSAPVTCCQRRTATESHAPPCPHPSAQRGSVLQLCISSFSGP